MIKSFLILIISSISLFSSQQILLVVADDFNTSHAKLEFFDGTKRVLFFNVNIGTNGLGWGIGEKNLTQNQYEPLKYEGDKKAPIGVFKLTDIFGYDFSANSNMPYLHTSKTLICVDDSKSPFYNQIIQAMGDEKSFEYMKRQDKQYQLGIVVAHNKNTREQRGSCIFLHVEKNDNASTAGCTSMKYENMKKIITMLDKNKSPILIQIPKRASKEILTLYPQLKESQLLH
jgi:L,D-peptidoglycan transpeptidase YkuD (ErfK/YbiS/YcfS/YnhG family)